MSKVNEKIKILQSIDRPENMSVEDELAWMLERVLAWTNPSGRIDDHYIPSWMAVSAKDAIRRYVTT